jgi:2-polyprenyl-3-methyl-5-hydroxy-6-metoxy-1,4-benzoquinol methylase
MVPPNETGSTGYEVDRTHWLEAQEWEKAFWDRYVNNQRRIGNLACFKTLVKKVLKRGPDEPSNLWWAKSFDQYRFVPDELENVIEFGCGPSTNLRIILNNRRVRHVIASDPLARHYVIYKGYYLAKRWRRAEWLVDDHALEETVFGDDAFDLAVCINVLDHVRSVDLCMKNLTRVVKPGGLLILGQELTNEEDLRATEGLRVASGSDIGHPHKFATCEPLLPYLREFRPVLQRVLSKEESRLPSWHCGTFLFAGEKNRRSETISSLT